MERREIRQLLEEHEFFRGLDAETLDFIADCGRLEHFAADTFVFREGEPADRFYVLRAGRVALEINTPERGGVVLDTLTEGEILGVSWLYPPFRWEFDAHALELTRAVALDATCLRAKCDREPRLGYELMKRVGAVLRRRMQSARVRLLDLYGRAHAG